MIKYVAYLFFPVLMFNAGSVYADHWKWHVAYGDEGKYCFDVSACNGDRKCIRVHDRVVARRLANGKKIRYCSNVAGYTNDTTVKTDYTIVVNDKPYVVSLTPPAENLDGSAVTTISKYIIYIGDTADTTNFSFKAELNTSGNTIINLTPAGIYYMSIVAIDSNGYESDFSNVITLN